MTDCLPSSGKKSEMHFFLTQKSIAGALAQILPVDRFLWKLYNQGRKASTHIACQAAF